MKTPFFLKPFFNPWVQLAVGVGVLMVLVTVVIPWIERSAVFHEMTQHAKEHHINSAGLFYTEVEQVYQWQDELAAQQNAEPREIR